MKKKIIGLFMGIGISLFASDIKTSIELDVFPYLSGGSYIGISLGKDNIKYRFVHAKSTLPDFYTPDEFESIHLDVYAFIIDYYFHEDFKGPWIGIGGEYWTDTVENKYNSQKEDVYQSIFTIGAGYVYNITEHFYVNPWIAGHLNIHNTDSDIGGSNYDVPAFMPEASIKFGYIF